MKLFGDRRCPRELWKGVRMSLVTFLLITCVSSAASDSTALHSFGIGIVGRPPTCMLRTGELADSYL